MFLIVGSAISHFLPSIRVLIAVALSPLFVVLLRDPVTELVGEGPTAKGISPSSLEVLDWFAFIHVGQVWGS